MGALGLARGEAQAVVVLPQPVGKRVIARAVAKLPQVVQAQKEGLIVVGLGTTNAYVLEELLGRPVPKEKYCAGYVEEELGVLPQADQENMVVLDRGAPNTLSWPEILNRLGPGDVVIKGGNALDPEGAVGVFVAAEDGGTVGKFYAAALARGVELVIPISRAKSVHASVSRLCQRLGKGRLAWASGSKVGLFPLHGTVITETEGVQILYGVNAEHVASGGVGRGQGAVVLLLWGESEPVARAFRELSELVRAEPELPWRRG